MSTPFQNRCPSTPADKAGCLEPAALKREHTSPRHRGAPGSPALPPTTDNVLGSRGWAPACPSRRALPTSAQVSTTARGACVNQAASVVFTLSPSAPRSAGMAGGAHHPNMAVTWSLSPATPDPPTARLGPPGGSSHVRGGARLIASPRPAETQVSTPGSWHWAGAKGEGSAFPKQALQSPGSSWARACATGAPSSPPGPSSASLLEKVPGQLPRPAPRHVRKVEGPEQRFASEAWTRPFPNPSLTPGDRPNTFGARGEHGGGPEYRVGRRWQENGTRPRALGRQSPEPLAAPPPVPGGWVATRGGQPGSGCRPPAGNDPEPRLCPQSPTLLAGRSRAAGTRGLHDHGDAERVRGASLHLGRGQHP